jgi:hypothetical protein
MNRRWGKPHLIRRSELSPPREKIFAPLQADKSTPIDEIVERPEPGMVVVRDIRGVVRT